MTAKKKDGPKCAVCRTHPMHTKKSDKLGQTYCLDCGTPYRQNGGGGIEPDVIPEAVPVIRRYRKETGKSCGLASLHGNDHRCDNEEFTGYIQKKRCRRDVADMVLAMMLRPQEAPCDT